MPAGTEPLLYVNAFYWINLYNSVAIYILEIWPLKWDGVTDFHTITARNFAVKHDYSLYRDQMKWNVMEKIFLLIFILMEKTYVEMLGKPSWDFMKIKQRSVMEMRLLMKSEVEMLWRMLWWSDIENVMGIRHWKCYGDQTLKMLWGSDIVNVKLNVEDIVS